MRFRPSAWPISNSEFSRALSMPRFSRNSVVRLMISRTVSIGLVVVSHPRMRGPRAAGQLGELLGEIGALQRGDDLLEIALHDRRQVVERQPDAMVGHAVLREIVGADALTAIARADLAAALRRVTALFLVFLL